MSGVPDIDFTAQTGNSRFECAVSKDGPHIRAAFMVRDALLRIAPHHEAE